MLIFCIMGEVCAWANRVMLTLSVWTLDCTYSIQLPHLSIMLKTKPDCK